jgi:hypothetical protein
MTIEKMFVIAVCVIGVAFVLDILVQKYGDKKSA